MSPPRTLPLPSAHLWNRGCTGVRPQSRSCSDSVLRIWVLYLLLGFLFHYFTKFYWSCYGYSWFVFLMTFFFLFFLRSRRNLEFDLYMCEVLLYSFFLCFHLSSSVVNMTKFPQLGWFSGTILLIIFILIMQCLERVSERGKAYNNRRRNETLMALGIWKGVVASCTPWICAGITAVVKAPFFSSDKRILCLPFLHQLQ